MTQKSWCFFIVCPGFPACVSIQLQLVCRDKWIKHTSVIVPTQPSAVVSLRLLTESCLSCFTPDSVYLAIPSLFLSRSLLFLFPTYCRSGPYHLIESVWQILPSPNQMQLARWLSVRDFWLRAGILIDNACMILCWYWKEPPSLIGVFLGHDSLHRCRHVFVMATEINVINVTKYYMYYETIKDVYLCLRKACSPKRFPTPSEQMLVHYTS